VLHCPHEVVELRKKDRDQLQHSLAYVETGPDSFPGYQLPTGTVIVDPPELRSTTVRAVAVYARVSSSENKNNLETQTERLISWCNAQGWEVRKIVKECGCGINDQRPKFLALTS